MHPPPHPAPQVLRFTGDFTTGLLAPSLRGRPLPRVVILRKHQLQSEQQGVFNHLTDLGDPPAPFEFVPHASQRAYVFRDIRSETVFFTTF